MGTLGAVASRPHQRTWLAILFVVTSAPLATDAARAQDAALAGLRKLEERYRALPHYRDHGSIAVTKIEPGALPQRQRFRLETVRSRDRFLLHLEGEGREILVWRDERQAKLWDSVAGERSVPTPTSGLAELLGWGEGTSELLLVHYLLAEPEAGLSPPSTATQEGPVPCGSRSCDMVLLSRLGGALETRLFVDRDDGLVRSVSARVLPMSEVLGRAMATAGIPRRGGSGATELLELELDEVSLEPPPAPPIFAPPSATTEQPPAPLGDDGPEAVAGTDRVSADRVSADRVSADHTYVDSIVVREITITVRVLDSQNRPIRDLGPNDFRARIGRQEVAVRSVHWVSSEEPLGWDIPPEVRAKYDIVVEAPGKLVLFFVQADLNPVRAKGQLRMLPETRRLMETFHPDDRIAVVSFDSHLKLRQDFTRDHEHIPEVLSRAIRYSKAEPPRPGPYPSLGRYMDEHELRRVASPERALEVTAEALSHFPGEKVVIFVGWGLGRYGAGGVRMTPDYDPAREALSNADATVFVLDISQADYHSLEVGLQQVAEDTGGTYDRTFHGPQLARERISAAISGHYVLTMEVPSGLVDAKRLRIELEGRKGRVVMPPTAVGGKR